ARWRVVHLSVTVVVAVVARNVVVRGVRHAGRAHAAVPTAAAELSLAGNGCGHRGRLTEVGVTVARARRHQRSEPRKPNHERARDRGRCAHMTLQCARPERERRAYYPRRSPYAPRDTILGPVLDALRRIGKSRRLSRRW